MQRYEINEERGMKNEEFSKNYQLSTFNFQLDKVYALVMLQRGVKLVVARLSAQCAALPAPSLSVAEWLRLGVLRCLP